MSTEKLIAVAAVAACCAVLAFAPARASCRVRVLHGADATGKSIYAGSFSPVTKATYTRYGEVVDIVEAGVYSLQFLVPQPVGTEPESCDRRVVRGGSWYSRPKLSTASFRRAYRTYAPVYDVGFRVVVEP